VTTDLALLADHLAVEAVMYRLADGVDSCNFSLYRSVFTETIDLDYSSYRPGQVGPWLADDWAKRCARLFPGLDASQHSITNVRIALAGDSAAVQAYVRADHVFIDDAGTHVFTVAGQYHDALIRTATGWLIASQKLDVRWNEGEAWIMDAAIERVATGKSVRG
jgi:SnoaL-like domain